MLNSSSNNININPPRSLLKVNRLTDLIAGHKAVINYLIDTKIGHGGIERIKVEEFIRTKLKNEMIKPILVNKIDKLFFQ